MTHKQRILNLLCAALQLTDGASDLIELYYDPRLETVRIVFEAGTRTVNVAMDSDTAMIRDVVNHLGC